MRVHGSLPTSHQDNTYIKAELGTPISVQPVLIIQWHRLRTRTAPSTDLLIYRDTYVPKVEGNGRDYENELAIHG